MRFFIGIFFSITFIFLTVNASAASHGKLSKSSLIDAKEKLVLMPLRVPEEDLALQGAMETALVKGLQVKYEVLSGEQVAKKAREIFNKESHNTTHKECDETRCLQNIAEAFQSELLAVGNIVKRADGYFLALSIRNIFDESIIYSESVPCKNCDAYDVVEKLKELSGTILLSRTNTLSASLSTAELPEPSLNAKSQKSSDESLLWDEIRKSNKVEDYKTYLEQHPKGQYVILAKSQIKKLLDEADIEATHKDDQLWQVADKSGTDLSYRNYIKEYPNGRHKITAEVKIRKLHDEQAANIELTIWNAAKTSRSVQSLNDYINKYPNGSHIKEASGLITQLNKAEVKPPVSVDTFTDCIGCPEMVIIPAGSFDMGVEIGNSNEKPLHRVTIGNSFAMGKTEVTQGQWKAIMKSNPSNFQNCGDNCPVENVSWSDAQDFIKKLNEKTGKQYRLPNEAEWEYACLAGNKLEFCGSDNIDSIAWYDSNSAETTHPVASKQPNAFGLYDMSGNVWEWVQDSFHQTYSDAPIDGSEWKSDSDLRVLRGGSYYNKSQFLHSYGRIRYLAEYKKSMNGFRVAKSLQ